MGFSSERTTEAACDTWQRGFMESRSCQKTSLLRLQIFADRGKYIDFATHFRQNCSGDIKAESSRAGKVKGCKTKFSAENHPNVSGHRRSHII